MGRGEAGSQTPLNATPFHFFDALLASEEPPQTRPGGQKGQGGEGEKQRFISKPALVAQVLLQPGNKALFMRKNHKKFLPKIRGFRKDRMSRGGCIFLGFSKKPDAWTIGCHFAAKGALFRGPTAVNNGLFF